MELFLLAGAVLSLLIQQQSRHLTKNRRLTVVCTSTVLWVMGEHRGTQKMG